MAAVHVAVLLSTQASALNHCDPHNATQPCPGGEACSADGVCLTSQPNCDQQLVADCNTARQESNFACGVCVGSHQSDLQAAGCNSTYAAAFCANETCTLDALCADARAQGAFQCAECLGTHEVNVTKCSLAQKEAFCNYTPPRPPKPCCSTWSTTHCPNVNSTAAGYHKCECTNGNCPCCECELCWCGYCGCDKLDSKGNCIAGGRCCAKGVDCDNSC